MSSSGTAQMTARKSSGCCVIAAPMSRPPFEPPEMASSIGARVACCRSRYSRRGDEVVEHVLLVLAHPGLVPVLAVLAAAAQVRHRVDAAGSSHGKRAAANDGVIVDVEAAVAVSRIGVVPSFGRSLRCTMNIEILVPSFDGYQTCSTTYGDVSIGTLTSRPRVDVAGLDRRLVDARRRGERGEREVGLVVVLVADRRRRRCRAPGSAHVAHELAVELADLEPARRVASGTSARAASPTTLALSSARPCARARSPATSRARACADRRGTRGSAARRRWSCT